MSSIDFSLRVRLSRFGLSVFCAAVIGASVSSASAQWTQWGGPHQDFKVDGATLAKEWPDEGPKTLWKHEIGDGYSAISVDGGTLYTMCRTKEKNKKERREVVMAINAKDGEVLWEHKYEAPVAPGHVAEFGLGPRGTPLVEGDKVYTVGVSGHMNCVDKKSGKMVWAHNLWEEYKGTFLNHGYSSSPVAYGETVIVPVGGKGHALMAFDQKTGDVVWAKHDFDNSYSTPKIIKVDDKDMMICFMAREIIGVDPSNGDLLWSHGHKNEWRQNITLPIWTAEERSLFITSPGDGSENLKLVKDGDGYKVEKLWENKKVGVHHTTAIRVGDCIYVSAGGSGGGPSFIQALDAKTGEVKWKERGFAKANFLYADGRFIVLDEDGNLGLAECTPEKFNIVTQYPILKKVSWTVPTLVGKTLYIRDQKQIMALNMG
ncbi:MAG: PQQ-binding-like beta-propeller repeat protein [Planctomycetes bacterium]|nr:PQQ-binding-like beta-propeller repeat protein [Planctomycetota bacterium]